MAGGDYGRIRHTFWTDPEIKRGLAPGAKLLLLYYCSNAHSSLCGLYYLPMEYAALETGLALDDVRQWTAGVLAPFVTYDERTEEILVHGLAKHQVAESVSEGDKRLPRVRKELEAAHSPALVRKFLTLYADWPIGMQAPPEPDPVEKSEPEAPSEPLGSPFEAIAVAGHGSTQQDNTDADASGGGAADDEPDEAEVWEGDIIEPGEDEPVPGTGAQIIPIGDRQRPAITAEKLQEVPEKISTWQVLGAWAVRQENPPDEAEKKKQGAAAKRLAERHSGRDIALAFLGIEALFEYSQGQPWDLFDLERKFSKAKAAAKDHPEVKRLQWEAEFNQASGFW